MAIKQAQLIAPVQLTGAFVAYLTTPANTTYRLGRAGFSNPSGAAITVTVCLVPPAGAPTAANQIMNAVNVPQTGPQSTYVSPELAGLVVPAGWSVQALASSAGAIVFYASGVSIQ